MVSSPVVFVASNAATQGGLAQVLAEYRSRPGELSFGSIGEGTSGHYLGEKLGQAGKLQMTHVPFASEARILQALMGGYLRSSFLTGISGRKAVDSGKARILAVAGQQRSPL